MQPDQSKAPAAKVLTGADRIATYLGCETRQVRHWHTMRRLPTFTIGRTVAARAEDLDQWLAELAEAGR